MNEVTINSIIRRSLMYHHLSIHYYLMFLSLALRGLREIKLHSLSKAIAVRLDVGADNMATLPSDFLSDILVGYETGDKVRPMANNLTLNTRVNDDGEDPPVDVPFDNTISNTLSARLLTYDPEATSNNLGLFGLGVHWDDSFTVLLDQGKIRLDANRSEDHIHLIYLSKPTTANVASLVSLFAEETLFAFIAWKWSENKKKNRFEVAPKKKDYYNALRILRASRNPATIHDIRRAVRRRFMLAPKN